MAEGRGRRYEQPDGGGGLAFCHVAHAEINALAGLPPTRHYEDHILVTTLEPCCICLGAAIQSTVTHLHFAGRDPYGGASDLVVETPQARRRPLAITGPLADERGGSPSCCTSAGCWNSALLGRSSNRCSAAARMSMKWPHALLPASYSPSSDTAPPMSAKR